MNNNATDYSSDTNRRTGDIIVTGTSVAVWEDWPIGRPDKVGIRQTFRTMLARLSARGWHIERDPGVANRYPIIADYHWIGSKGDLRMVGETTGRMASVEFYQEINVENVNGGRYDFSKFARMPRRLRLACVVEMGAAVGKLLDLGYALDKTRGVRADAINASILRVAENLTDASNPLALFNDRWTASRFERDENGWPTPREIGGYGNATDRDKATLRNGDTRYFRRRGRLMRGTVYTNMGNMWMVVYGGSVTYVASWELFSCDRPDLEPRRVVAGQAKRLRAEMDKALKKNDHKRAKTLADVMLSIKDGV